MKTLLWFVFECFVIPVLCFMSSCRKGGSIKDSSTTNIVLYNKPLPVIQSNIQGEWKLDYEKGGICSICINSFRDVNYIWKFGSGDKVVQTFNGAIFTDTTISWVKDLGMYMGTDSTFIMEFYDKRDYPYVFVVDGVLNDSLQLHDNGYDPVYYYFYKLKK